MDQRYGTGPGPDLRPLSAGETLAGAIGVYSGNALQLWAAVAVVVIPLELIELIIRLTSIPSGEFVHDGALYTNNLTAASSGLGASLVVGLIGGLAQLLAIGAVFRLVLDDYLGRHTSVQESFEFAADRLLSLLWIAILVAVFVGIGFVLLFFPGLYLLAAFSVAIPVLMAEGIKGDARAHPLAATGQRTLVGDLRPTVHRLAAAARPVAGVRRDQRGLGPERLERDGVPDREYGGRRNHGDPDSAVHGSGRDRDLHRPAGAQGGR